MDFLIVLVLLFFFINVFFLCRDFEGLFLLFFVFSFWFCFGKLYFVGYYFGEISLYNGVLYFLIMGWEWIYFCVG